ncbi:DUF4012 domain-containing protein [Candidatus Gracilibacteria bacterium]|nr:DUF4012 domain-containing protein [Candidatus Gracilibacteria bacterium]
MLTFGIKKDQEKSFWKNFNFNTWIYIFFLVFCFSIFSFYSNVTNLVFSKDKIDVFKEDLNQISFYFWNFDRSVSEFLLDLDEVVQDYVEGDNVMITREKEIDEIWLYVKKHRDYLGKLGFSNYNYLMDFVAKAWNYKQEIFTLLGKDQPFNYLVLLENTNEKRPNGGFFGSFAFIRVNQGHIETLEIVDSYYPDFIAYNTRLRVPNWSTAFLSDPQIGFISANKFGFSDVDGKNIKDLYEKMFNETYDMAKVEKTMAPDLYDKLLHKYIKGVIFIRSDLIEKLMPGIKEKIWERQFLNASVDLIRNEVRGNKKEIYIKEVKDFFNQNKELLTKNFVNQFQDILDKNMFSIYLSNVSTGLSAFVKSTNLQTVFSTDNIYAWDTNNSFNKVDGFVSKKIQIKNTIGDVLLESNTDVINIKDLPQGIYDMKILYTLSIPQEYFDFIASLEKKYGITLTDREQSILALKPAVYEPDLVKKWRETKATVYFPFSIDILDVKGEIFNNKYFVAPFANGLFYQMRINDNGKSKSLNVKFQVRK